MENPNETQINCAEACVDGCVLGDKCPNLQYVDRASQFIQNTSIDKMHEIADMAFRKKMSEPPKWIIPDFPD
ncbi:MAG TPA: hypothetical protein IGS17_05430 [Oscillatoriales cyanobacterium M59_W2019_021]|nr:MAG: hypothetical protein D6728_01055 [Cyanobacteria bacterium J055]HIK31656.1 hypothetical protein [Oscillatoriales cyanobacterium M4454_W2019_049]HIK50355.1 hypothetical protein [Oscillatoriales cyanobacterium M59_W2019_021]